MPSAKLALDPDWLLDELELRLTRCTFDGAPLAPSVRMGGVRQLGASLHEVANQETFAWWDLHRLGDVDDATQSNICSALLGRSPKFLAWATVPLFHSYLHHHLRTETVLDLVDWLTAPESAEQVIRDAVALNLVLPWWQTLPEVEVGEQFDRWCLSGDAAKARLSLVAMAAYIRDGVAVGASLASTTLRVCWQLGKRVDPEIAMSVGWLLRELVRRDQDRIFPTLLERAQELSRKAMRTAVEGLPRDLRIGVTRTWTRHRQDRGNLVMVEAYVRSPCKPRIVRGGSR